MTAAACHPRHDPTFHDRVLWDLFSHPNEWRKLGRLFAGHVDCWERANVIREAVDKGRRLGFEIEGDRRRGYRVVGFTHPEMVYLVRPGCRPGRDGEGESSGQLSLVSE